MIVAIGGIILMRTKESFQPRLELSCAAMRIRAIDVANAVAVTFCFPSIVLLVVHMVHSGTNLLVPGIVTGLTGIALACACCVVLVHRNASFKLTQHGIVCREVERGSSCHGSEDQVFNSAVQASDENIPLRADTETSTSKEDDTGTPSRTAETSAKFKSFCMKKTQGSFVETTLCVAASLALQTAKSILIISSFADGKSSILWYLAANTEHLPVPCSNLTDVEEYLNESNRKERFLFVFDDVFGGSFLQQSLLSQWINRGEKLKRYLETHTFVFATRNTIWADCKVYLKNMIFFRTTVEVTSAKLTVDDKRKLLWAHLGSSVTLGVHEVEKISRIENPLAYVHCCKQMEQAVQTDQTVTEIVGFFERPYAYLQSEVRKMTETENLMHATLCLIMLCGGRLKCQELSDAWAVASDVSARISACDLSNETCTAIRECAEKLTGTYLEKGKKSDTDFSDTNVYTFSHDSLFDAVLTEYGQSHPLEIVKFLRPDLAVQVIRPNSFEEDGNEIVIKVSEDHYKDVAEMFTHVCIDGDHESVFQNPVVKDEQFQNIWCHYLKSSKEKKKTLRKCKGNHCVIYHAHKADARILFEYLSKKKLHEISDKCKCIKYSVVVHSDVQSQ